MTDQISFLPMLEPRDTTFEDNERIAEQICTEEWQKAHGNTVAYVAACVARFGRECAFPYDLRDDDRVKNEDVVGKCFLCGRDVTAQDVCLVNAVTYTWERKDGTTIEAYECFGSHACREPVVTTCDCTDTAFHNAYLRLTGYTERKTETREPDGVRRKGGSRNIPGGIMKTLTISLKKQWFDMIKAGVKKEEYREICDYWGVRFAGHDVWANEFCIKDVNEIELKHFDRLVFTLGYPKADDTERRLTFKNPKIRIGTGLPEWGAEPGKHYFVITWEN